MEPNTKLFPALFVIPSSQNVLQFELGKLKVRTFQDYLIIASELIIAFPIKKSAFIYRVFFPSPVAHSPPAFSFSCLLQNIMPISAAMFRSERKNPVPQCPPRLDVQMLTPVVWSRMPNHFLAPRTARVSERHGWMVECTEPLIMMALHIPEENRSARTTLDKSLILKSE